MMQVGQQSIIASLLRSESNALQIEACNEALTDLISLFNVRVSTLIFPCEQTWITGWGWPGS
jgi:hypothetical protein